MSDESTNDAATLRELLLQQKRKIAIAESLTGGNLQALLTSVSGASDVFEGGTTAYNLTQKTAILGVDRDHAASVNCVSEQVAKEMALGVAEQFQVDTSAATTGYAEPWPDAHIDTPFAFFAISIDREISTGRIECPGLNRQQVQHAVAHAVVKKLIERLSA